MDLVEQLRRDDGVRYVPYTDSMGNATIGVGHKILPGENFSWAVQLTDGQVNSLLNQDIAIVQNALAVYRWYVDMGDPIRQASIQNMAFNLGIAGLLHFPLMIGFIVHHDWANAAAQCDDPHWRSQVHARADRIAQQLLTGAWV